MNESIESARLLGILVGTTLRTVVIVAILYRICVAFMCSAIARKKELNPGLHLFIGLFVGSVDMLYLIGSPHADSRICNEQDRLSDAIAENVVRRYFEELDKRAPTSQPERETMQDSNEV